MGARREELKEKQAGKAEKWIRVKHYLVSIRQILPCLKSGLTAEAAGRSIA